MLFTLAYLQSSVLNLWLQSPTLLLLLYPVGNKGHAMENLVTGHDTTAIVSFCPELHSHAAILPVSTNLMLSEEIFPSFSVDVNMNTPCEYILSFRDHQYDPKPWTYRVKAASFSAEYNEHSCWLQRERGSMLYQIRIESINISYE